MPNQKQLRNLSFLVLILGLAAIVWFFLLPGTAIETPAKINSETQDATPTLNVVKVTVDTARMATLVKHLSTTGLTRAVQEVIISPKIGGEIARLPVEEGVFVRKGALLMQLDDREYQLALAEAQDKMLGAQVEYGMLSNSNPKSPKSARNQDGTNGSVAYLDSLRQKFRRGEINDRRYRKEKLEVETRLVLSGARRLELIAHKSGLTAAAVAEQRAELNLSYTEIRAPFAGLVADLKVDRGQQIIAGQVCCKLLDLTKIDVELQVLESEIGLLAEGRKAELTFPAYPGEAFHGFVVHINPKVDAESKTIRVTVRLPNREKRILPGMFAYANLEAQIFTNRFLVPREAILLRDQRKLLFIVRNGLAKWCYVETGRENARFVEILSSTFGLKPGELVITYGHFTLVHDARVVISY